MQRSTYWHYSAGSPVWHTDLGDAFRQSFDTAIPTIIVHGTWDTQTPWENAEELAPHFTNSRFISVGRGSHGALGEAMKVEQTFKPALIKFMVTGDFSDLPDEVQLPGPKWTLPPANKDR